MRPGVSSPRARPSPSHLRRARILGDRWHWSVPLMLSFQQRVRFGGSCYRPVPVCYRSVAEGHRCPAIIAESSIRYLKPILIFSKAKRCGPCLGRACAPHGDVVALILRENGERLFVNCLDDLRAEIERHARGAAGIKGSTCLN